MHTKLTVVVTSGNKSNRNETWVRVKGEPHFVLEIRSKYHVIPKDVTLTYEQGKI